MTDLEKAIQEITFRSKIFPEEAFRTITADREGALPYLRAAIEKAVREQDALDPDYQLHFYALFLLAEFQDRESFPRIMELAALPEGVLDYLIGDAITSSLSDILYNTYNGDIELLESYTQNTDVYQYVRSAMLSVMGQLYLDGVLKEREWRTFIKRNVYRDEGYNYVYNELASLICRCHFVDMLPEIRYLFDNEKVDDKTYGKYESLVDYMFDYSDYREQRLCKSSLNAADSLRTWAMFESEENTDNSKKATEALEKFLRAERLKSMRISSPRKIGRNEPCPCGSGKKYKFCCMNKPLSPMEQIESAEERQKCLKDYPYTGKDRQEGRVYLEDYFDPESIEIDRLLYLALVNRPVWIWERNRAAEDERSRKYLTLAFRMFTERVEREGIRTFEEYDRKYSIHYFSEEWIYEFLRLLRENGDQKLFAEVEECRKRLGE